MYNVPSGNRKKPEEMKVNLVPVLDGVFILIFFLLTVNTYSNLMEINSDVPVFKLSSIDEKNKKIMTIKIKYRNQFIEVINDSNGSKIFEFKGEVDSIASELHQFLIKLKLEYPQEEKAILQIDEQVVYEDLVKIMDSVRQQRIAKKVAPLFPRLMFF